MTDVQKIWLNTKLEQENREAKSRDRIERLKSKAIGRRV